MAGMLLMGMYWYVSWQGHFLFGIQSRVADMVRVEQSFGSLNPLERLDFGFEEVTLTLIRA